MSVAYGGPPGSAGYQPPGRVNFGWISEAWRFVGQAAGLWILGVLLYGIINTAVNGILVHLFPNPNYVPMPGPFGGAQTQFGIRYGTDSNVTAAGQVIGALFAWLFGAFQAASLYHFAVKQVRGEPIAIGDLVGGGKYFGNMLILNLVTFFLFFAGILAFCIGIFVVSAFLLPAAALVADGTSVAGALSQSIAGMKRDWLNATLFFFVFVLLIVASVIPCGLGLLVTIPMVYLVGVLAYRDMIGMPGTNQSGPSYGETAAGVWPPAPGAWPPPPQAYPPPQAPPPPRQSLSGEPLDDPGQTPPDRGL